MRKMNQMNQLEKLNDRISIPNYLIKTLIYFKKNEINQKVGDK